MLAFQQSTY